MHPKLHQQQPPTPAEEPPGPHGIKESERDGFGIFKSWLSLSLSISLHDKSLISPQCSVFSPPPPKGNEQVILRVQLSSVHRAPRFNTFMQKCQHQFPGAAEMPQCQNNYPKRPRQREAWIRGRTDTVRARHGGVCQALSGQPPCSFKSCPPPGEPTSDVRPGSRDTQRPTPSGGMMLLKFRL